MPCRHCHWKRVPKRNELSQVQRAPTIQGRFSLHQNLHQLHAIRVNWRHLRAKRPSQRTEETEQLPTTQILITS